MSDSEPPQPTDSVLDEVQGHVFRPIRQHRTSVKLFVDHNHHAIPDLLRWLIADQWVRTMATCRKDTDRPSVVVALTHPALLALGPRYRPLLVRADNEKPTLVPPPPSSEPEQGRRPSANFLPDPFRAGMRARRRALGDPKTDAPQVDKLEPNKEQIYTKSPDEPTSPVDLPWRGYDKGLLLWISTPAHVGEDLAGTFPASALEEASSFGSHDPTRELVTNIGKMLGEASCHCEIGYWYPIETDTSDDVDRDKLLLGFPDGTSQPYVAEFATPGGRTTLAGGGTPTPDGWEPVPLGEFVLGHRNAGGTTEAPGPRWLTRNGTFLVYRKYRIFSDRYERQLAEAAARLAGEHDDEFGVEDLAAKTMGRYRQAALPDEDDELDSVVSNSNGTTDARWIGAEPVNRNDFRYELDTTGFLCPLGAHVRRSNPRDALGFDGSLVKRHRLFRRGSFRTIEPGNSEDPTPREQELHFIAINADIAAGFEFVQRQWLNSGHSFRLGEQPDLFAGNRPDGEPARLLIQGEQPVVFESPEPLSELKGGDYFFVPALKSLSQLAIRPEESAE